MITYGEQYHSYDWKTLWRPLWSKLPQYNLHQLSTWNFWNVYQSSSSGCHMMTIWHLLTLAATCWLNNCAVVLRVCRKLFPCFKPVSGSLIKSLGRKFLRIFLIFCVISWSLNKARSVGRRLNPVMGIGFRCAVLVPSQRDCCKIDCDTRASGGPRIYHRASTTITSRSMA